jgi:hypothetical protein
MTLLASKVVVRMVAFSVSLAEIRGDTVSGTTKEPRFWCIKYITLQ